MSKAIATAVRLIPHAVGCTRSTAIGTIVQAVQQRAGTIVHGALRSDEGARAAVRR